jgi:hypothetical protein
MSTGGQHEPPQSGSYLFLFIQLHFPCSYCCFSRRFNSSSGHLATLLSNKCSCTSIQSRVHTSPAAPISSTIKNVPPPVFPRPSVMSTTALQAQTRINSWISPSICLLSKWQTIAGNGRKIVPTNRLEQICDAVAPKPTAAPTKRLYEPSIWR